MVWVEVRPCRRVRTRSPVAFAGRIGGLCGFWSGWCAAAGIGVGIHRAFSSGEARTSWPPEPCVVRGVDARCGTFVVPENRAKPDGRTIGLRVVVLPAFSKPARKDAVAYLAGGPGDAATEQAVDQGWQSSALVAYRDILLVDQRGTGRSKPHGADVTQYGTRMAMDDLDAVRAALGYRQLDVIGSSYGATAAQVYLKLHPSSVRTLILTGATAIDVPFFDRYAVNAQRALDQLARLCASDPACRKAFPDWERQFGALVKAWNAHPVNGMTGDELASVVHVMLLDLDKAVSIPLVVSRAATGRLRAPRASGLRGSRRRPQPHGLVDLVQRALDRARREGAVGHRLRQLHDGPDRGVPAGLQLRPEARRAALALEAPHLQPRAGTRLRRRRRPAGSRSRTSPT